MKLLKYIKLSRHNGMIEKLTYSFKKLFIKAIFNLEYRASISLNCKTWNISRIESVVVIHYVCIVCWNSFLNIDQLILGWRSCCLLVRKLNIISQWLQTKVNVKREIFLMLLLPNMSFHVRLPFFVTCSQTPFILIYALV